MITAQELKDLFYWSCVGEGQRGPTNADGAIDDVYAELARVTQELEAQKQGYKNLMVLNHEYTDETALERQQLKKELAEALSATADWRARLVKAEVDFAMLESDAELERVTLERDQACLKRDQAMELLKAAAAYNDTYSLNLAETRAELSALQEENVRLKQYHDEDFAREDVKGVQLAARGFRDRMEEAESKLERVRAAVLKIADQITTEDCVGGWDWAVAELRKAVEGEAP